jgi:hypothetical protein
MADPPSVDRHAGQQLAGEARHRPPGNVRIADFYRYLFTIFKFGDAPGKRLCASSMGKHALAFCPISASAAGSFFNGKGSAFNQLLKGLAVGAWNMADFHGNAPGIGKHRQAPVWQGVLSHPASVELFAASPMRKIGRFAVPMVIFTLGFQKRTSYGFSVCEPPVGREI